MQPFTWLAGLLAAYVAQVCALARLAPWARVRSAPTAASRSWLPMRPSASARVGGVGWAARRRGLRVWPGRTRLSPPQWRRPSWRSPSGCPRRPRRRGRPRPPAWDHAVLDVGQGDSILLDPADGEPVLVDGGPHGDDLRPPRERGRREAGGGGRDTRPVRSRGGIEELLGILPIRRLLYAQRGPDFPRNAEPRMFGRARSRRVPRLTREVSASRSCGRPAALDRRRRRIQT